MLFINSNTVLEEEILNLDYPQFQLVIAKIVVRLLQFPKTNLKCISFCAYQTEVI